MKRRSFLRGMAAAPLGAKVAAEQVTMQMAGISGVGAALADGGPDVPAGGGYVDEPAKFTDFAKWLMAGGEKEIRDRAQYVTALDPDILCLSVPLWIKMQWQRDRNFERERGRMKERFTRALEGEGFFRWYF